MIPFRVKTDHISALKLITSQCKNGYHSSIKLYISGKNRSHFGVKTDYISE